MSKSKAQYFKPSPVKSPIPGITQPQVTSLLDKMKEGREYESIIGLQNIQVELGSEFRLALHAITTIRRIPSLCYISNMLSPPANANISINPTDEKPFLEMIDAVPSENREIDIILATPGGSAEIVSTLVTKLRSRFDKVNFILPYLAMSAGTIFCLSGDDLIMDENSSIGPIDPQVPTKDGRYLPAQALISLIQDIQNRGSDLKAKGKQPLWTDVQILNSIDKRELGNVITASQFSTNLVSEYLRKYKFKSWTQHSDGRPVTQEERDKTAEEIANKLCDHSKWLNHASRISREQAWTECHIKVIPTEKIEGLTGAVRKLWALLCYAFENTPVYKCIFSENYTLFRMSQNTK